jgi:hypothetical protein
LVCQIILKGEGREEEMKEEKCIDTKLYSGVISSQDILTNSNNCKAIDVCPSWYKVRAVPPSMYSNGNSANTLPKKSE